MTTSPHAPTATCRWCGQPIRTFFGDGRPVWVHAGRGGAFPCRDALTRMCLPTQAAPPDPTARGATVGRHRAGPDHHAESRRPAPRPHGRPVRGVTPRPHPQGRAATMARPPVHSRPSGNRSMAGSPRDASRHQERRRPLSVFLSPLLRRRRPSRARSLDRLNAAIGCHLPA